MDDKMYNKQHVQTSAPRYAEGRSQSMREELKEEEAMGNDVERLHSEGDEPDLCQYIRTKSDPAE